MRITQEMVDTNMDARVLRASGIVLCFPDMLGTDDLVFFTENQATIYGRLFYGTSCNWHLSTEC